MSALVFLTPWVLWGLLGLPLLWWILRATPPSPKHLKFPGVGLLMGMEDAQIMPSHTPLWLLMLRIFALAAAIIAFAEPTLNPEERSAGRGPLLVLMDGGWASATDWDARISAAENILEQAANQGRPTVFASLADDLPAGGEMPFNDARAWLPKLRGTQPMPWAPDRTGATNWLSNASNFETIWLTDGLDYGDDFAAHLTSKGPLRILATGHTPVALTPLELFEGQLSVTATSTPQSVPREISATAYGSSPNGAQVVFSKITDTLSAGENAVTLRFDLPVELTNRVNRIEVAGENSAGAVALADDGARRPKVAIAGPKDQTGPQLVSPVHYLRSALVPAANLIEGNLTDVLLSAPDVIVLVDVGELSIKTSADLLTWVEKGGLLLRFAGPRTAAAVAGQIEVDPLFPVRLRAGGRSLGGAMSWGAPKRLAPFAPDSPFFGLPTPPEVEVFAQVVAQPDRDLAERTLAELEDGTPLVTRRRQGDGRVVLFHVTANSDWSTLPLSGLFVEMLQRLTAGTGSSGTDAIIADRHWTQIKALDGRGRLGPSILPAPIDGNMLLGPATRAAPAGLYTAGDMTVAVNVLRENDRLQRMSLPAGFTVETLGETPETSLQSWFLLAALALFAVDILGTLWASGRFVNRGAVQSVIVLLAFANLAPQQAEAQDLTALAATTDTVLAYVKTGDRTLDQISAAGLSGLGEVLFNRTSIEPAAPIGVNIETDELAFFPMLYWPISAQQTLPSQEAALRLNRYLSNGGMIVFDTRDAQLGSGYGVATENGKMLQRITALLDVPPLAPVPEGHVLTRAFYLLDDFPGRWAGPVVWVEMSADSGGTVLGGNRNDGVTPIVIGANDWASAWAIDDNGQALFPVGRGITGERQREIARRFGVNLVMYVMTGSYKADQVHVPAFLERLGEK